MDKFTDALKGGASKFVDGLKTGADKVHDGLKLGADKVKGLIPGQSDEHEANKEVAKDSGATADAATNAASHTAGDNKVAAERNVQQDEVRL